MRGLVALACIALVATPAHAGVYAFVRLGTSDPPLFGIVHPPHFNGAGGMLNISVCTASGNPELMVPVQDSMAVWNALAPLTGNCMRCMRVEDIPARPPIGQDLRSVILHELGHVLGLDHTNLLLAGVSLSYSNGVGTNSVDIGSDGVRGSSDDHHLPEPPDPNPARIINWFRIQDNNPIIVDGLVIEETTFTRARSSLPAGHVWPTNANSDYRQTVPPDDTADLLGLPNSQAVMYSFLSERQVYQGLGADDSSTLRFGMTGLDKMAGNADDYTYAFSFVADCNQADVEVSFVDPVTDPDLDLGVLGVTIEGVTGIPQPPNQTQHYFVRPATGRARIEMKLNDRVTWDIDLVFGDGFESGDTSAWSFVQP